MSIEQPCPFCERLREGAVQQRLGNAASFADGYPVASGHALVVPSRHEADFFKLTPEERHEMWELVDIVQSEIEREHQPDGFNIGVNIGEAAGQTVGHAHIHVIPRFSGDVDDPRGGLRWVIPGRANYWDRT